MLTETCADLTNTVPIAQPCHPYTEATTPQIAVQDHHAFHPSALLPYNPNPPATPLEHTDVYIDDFLLAARRSRHTHLLHTLLHHLHTIFRDTPDSPRRLIVLSSKVKKGDATFDTTKCILGWEIDTYRMAIHLPHHRLLRLSQLITTTLDKRYTTCRKWRQLLGVL